MSIISNIASSAKPSLTIRRRFNAPPASVYAAWTDPEQMQRWFGPAGAHTLQAQADLRVGGRFRIMFTTPDGEEHEASGVYREIADDAKLVFTWAWRSTPERETLITVALMPDGGGTLMIFTQEQFFDEAARDRHNVGWSQSFDKLTQHLERS
jgi:uncharacterized protein YndB with AHSA1/START domain